MKQKIEYFSPAEDAICPNCKEQRLMPTHYTKPIEFITLFCDACGLSISGTVTYESLEDLNAVRQDNFINSTGSDPEYKEHYKILTKLPPQKIKRFGDLIG